MTSAETDIDGTATWRDETWESDAIPDGAPVGPAPHGPATSGVEVVLEGLLCPDRHPNPPGGRRCRRCGRAIDIQDPVLVTRPPLGHLRLPSGERLLLERDVLLGRRPTAEPGAEQSHLVKISDSHEVSRTHVRIALRGWRVLARDLGTTNSTWLTIPGEGRTKLAPHQDHVLVHGAVIDIAEELEIIYEQS